jgi:bifunctional enzyme CysN/CysC
MDSLSAFLEQELNKDLLRFTLVGSVDDGKSTLIGRLIHDTRNAYEDELAKLQAASQRQGGQGAIDFAHLTDGLKAEREQGITIDVAYRYFSTAKRKFIIADTPGHEQYTRNMATGASTADAAIILIDASQGVRAQSKRHGFIAALLGIRHMIVAVNKMDKVGYRRDAFEKARSAYAAFAAKLELRDIEFIPISALVGDNVLLRSDKMPWYEGSTLLHRLENLHIASDRNLVDLRLPIQYVIRPNESFRGYAGTLAAGVLRPGDKVVAMESGQETQVASLVSFDGEVSEACASQAVTVTLADEIDLGRGDMLVHPRNRPRVAHKLEAMLVWMREAPASQGYSCLLKHSTRTVPATLTQLLYTMDVNTLHRQDAQELRLNDIARVTVDLQLPVFADAYTHNRATGSFILIDKASNDTVAAGMIIEREPDEPARRVLMQETVSAPHLTTHFGDVSAAERGQLLGQTGVVVWFTGLSASGKSTLAFEVEKQLIRSGRLAYVLDGDGVRQGLCADLGFSPADRTENIRRIGEVAAILADAGVIVLSAFISPYRTDRERARKAAPDGRFLEVFVDVPLETCEQRDPKDLYKKARAGIIPNFTGIGAPYEAPEAPELRLPFHEMTPEEGARRVVAMLETGGVLTPKG